MDSSLKSDRELIMEAIRQSGKAFLFTPTYIQSQDKEIAAMALIQSPSLGISCHPLLYDCDYISQLVRRDGRILQSLPLILKQNPEIVKLAIESNGMNVKHASLEMLMQNLELIELAVSKNGLALQHVTQHPTFMQYLKSHKISNQKQTTSYLEVIIEKALEQNPMALQYCPDSYRSNRDVVLNLLSRNGMVLEFVSSELQHDLEVVNTALRQNANSLQFVPYEIICKNERSVLSAIMQQNNIQALKYYPKERLWSMYEKILNETS
ncbi:hypothetical protein C9374_002625 [Naegleria lovaniensis]|uniref:DUF4116 domain-containing protein n=1 Tax=Naegleria lovaniensis TaxID=51637 RepID=A0AA88GUX1_NAELO|nr:uncharacterized protein C9374_002625 [Naegleria lovaniensis]KAG2386179.1 hypothetical protein C9374_002625 [Naegleria lovaniensis]